MPAAVVPRALLTTDPDEYLGSEERINDAASIGFVLRMETGNFASRSRSG